MLRLNQVKNIHEKMNEIAQEHKEDPEPVVLDKNEVKTIFASSGVANDRMEVFDQCFDATAGESTSLMMTNVYNPRSFEVKTPDVVIKVNPERTDLVNTKMIDGRQCLPVTGRFPSDRLRTEEEDSLTSDPQSSPLIPPHPWNSTECCAGQCFCH